MENLHRYQQEFAPATLIRLEQNYRSTGTILAAANALIQHNHERLGKELWTSGESGEPIRLYTAYNETDEARFIVERAQAWVAAGGRYQDCAALYRSNAQSRALENALMQAGVPYRVYGGLRFYERAEIKAALAYLRLIANRSDDSAFERVINLPPRGIGERTIETLRAMARHASISLWQAAQHTLLGSDLNARAKTAIAKFLALIDGLETDAHTHALPLAELTEAMFKATGLLQHYREQKEEKDQMRVENLEELLTDTSRFQAGLDQDPLLEFLSRAALDAGDEQAPQHQDCVQLMTLHAAKGLEFPLVFLCGMEENLFPHALSAQTTRGLEEERRLCYVGMTRARQQLILTHAEVRRLHGTDNYTRPSRFMHEIPAELIAPVRARTVARPLFTANHAPAPTALSFQLGQNVRHPTFGEGVVLAYEGSPERGRSGEQARIQVYFAQHGEKWLIMEYARLDAG